MDLDREIQRIFLREESLDDLAPRAKDTHPARHWSRAVIMERIAYLKEMARFGNGLAAETVREAPGHAAMLLLRTRTGEAELHDKHADYYIVQSGAATLITGGRIENARDTGPGETRGDAIDGGRRQQLGPGDVAYVPAGVPHQFELTGDATISYFMIKIELQEEDSSRNSQLKMRDKATGA